MKTKLLILLLIPFFLIAQDVEYKFIGPVETTSITIESAGLGMSGNSEDGYLVTNGNTIYSIDPENKFKLKKIKSYKLNYTAYLNNKGSFKLKNIYYNIFQDGDNLIARKSDKDGGYEEEFILFDATTVNVKNIQYQVYQNREQLIVEFKQENNPEKYQPQIFYKIYNKDMKLITGANITLEDKMYNFWIDNLYYNDSDDKVYGRFYKRITNNEKDNDLNYYGTLVVSNKKDIEFIKDKTKDYSSGELFIHSEKNRLIGLGFNEERNEVFTFSNEVDGMVEFVDKQNVQFSLHPNFKDRTVDDKIKFSNEFIDIKHLEDGSFITCYKLHVDMGSSIHNLLFTKYNKDGDILFNTTIPIAGLSYVDNFHFDLTEDKIYVVYVDFLDHLELEGKKYDGKYVMASSINNNGEKSTKVLFHAEKYGKDKIYHAFSNSFNIDPQTFVSFLYKKKKEDYIVVVNFND